MASLLSMILGGCNTTAMVRVLQVDRNGILRCIVWCVHKHRCKDGSCAMISRSEWYWFSNNLILRHTYNCGYICSAVSIWNYTSTTTMTLLDEASNVYNYATKPLFQGSRVTNLSLTVMSRSGIGLLYQTQYCVPDWCDYSSRTNGNVSWNLLATEEKYCSYG